MFKVEPPKKHMVRHSIPRNPQKSDEPISKSKTLRSKKTSSPIPSLTQRQEDNYNISHQVKIPKSKQRNAYTARSTNPRFRNKLSKSPSPYRINSDGIIKEAPITPEEAKSRYLSSLTSYELDEIMIYDEIYYLGQKSKKIKPNSTGLNHGYDDDNHHYKAVIGDQLAYRFEIRAVLGKGVYGEVLRCYDHKTKTNVAVKVIINCENMRQQGELEISILQHLNGVAGHENSSVIRSIDYFIFRNHICVSFEILGQNLYEFSKSTMHSQPMSSSQIKAIAFDVLNGLAFIHRNYVVHCDLKPENILVASSNSNSNSNSNSLKVKIIDFGSSCYIGRQRQLYIQSRFYRAPEVILGIPYGPPMDVWSCACIIAELMNGGKPLFPGTDEAEQLEMYMEVFGLPPRDVIDASSRKNYFFDNSYTPLVRSQARRKRKVGSLALNEMTKLKDPLLIDLLGKCFVWNQNERITAEEALRHPFFTTREVKSARSTGNIPGLPNLK
ncbi:hypothetical protein M9Y10_024856 [Tritrichomonas musculus]|uniref:dual-specificity kinase n=1 Tax=Tritrichomonas musculus TaxID=1915356 RepID=A0ABR2HC89_9EUKA